MKNNFFVRILLILSAVVGMTLLFGCGSKQTLQTQKGGSLLGVLPFDDRCTSVYLAPDLKFCIDLGATASRINRRDLQWLMDRGYAIDSSFCIASGRDSENGFFMAFKSYRVDLPVWKWHTVDSIVRDSSNAGGLKLVPYGTTPGNILRGVILLAADDDDESILGRDFFGNIAVEYKYFNNALKLYREVPKEYQALTDLLTDLSIGDMFDGIPDYYITLDVDGVRNDYRLLSRTGNVALKLPSDERPLNRNVLSRIEVLDRLGTRTPADWNADSWIGIGDRIGNFPSCYFDDSNWDDRCINPFLFFNQDFVLSFADNLFYVYPHCDAPKRTPLAWQDYTTANER